MSQPRPRIGITTGDRTDDARNRRYVDYVAAAGGEPLLLRPRDRASLDALALDGLLLSGGLDVDPAEYGQPLDPTAHVETDPDRDRLELPIARQAIERGLPVLGICRGFQVLNVLHGGTLVQHLDGHRLVGEAAERTSAQHPVRVAPDSLLGRLLARPELTVNTRHHQAVRPEDLAPSLRPTAWSPDGLVEALERPDAPGWLLAVQWHPERVDECDPACLAIARALVDAARQPAARR